MPIPQRTPQPTRQLSRLRLLGLLFCLLGATVITLGWMGTARVACVDCQMPYLLSGGAAGLGLIIFGVGLLVIAQLRAEGIKLAEHLTALTQAEPVEEPTIPVQRSTADTEPLPVPGSEPDQR